MAGLAGWPACLHSATTPAAAGSAQRKAGSCRCCCSLRAPARSLEVEQTATFTPASMASSAAAGRNRHLGSRGEAKALGSALWRVPGPTRPPQNVFGPLPESVPRPPCSPTPAPSAKHHTTAHPAPVALTDEPLHAWPHRQLACLDQLVEYVLQMDGLRSHRILVIHAEVPTGGAAGAGGPGKKKGQAPNAAYEGFLEGEGLAPGRAEPRDFRPD